MIDLGFGLAMLAFSAYLAFTFRHKGDGTRSLQQAVVDYIDRLNK